MGKYIVIPTTWTMYEAADDVIGLLGSQMTTPPHIALELMVAHGVARKISTFTTSRASEVAEAEDADEEEEGKEFPW